MRKPKGRGAGEEGEVSRRGRGGGQARKLKGRGGGE